MLILLGIGWAAFFVWLDTIMGQRRVHYAETWQGEHTIVLVAVLVGVLAPRWLRPTHEAARTLVHGRAAGLRDALATTLPTLAAAVIVLATMSVLMSDHRCCFCAPPTLPWNSLWSLYWIVPALLGSLVAATGLRAPET